MKPALSDPAYMDDTLREWQRETLRAVVLHISGEITDAERDLAVQQWNEQVALARERACDPATLPQEST